jgi:LysM repeat protein
MALYRFLFVMVLLAGSQLAFAQPAEYKMTRDEYVEKYKDDAIKEMLVHGVPASITLAQGMLESGNGNSALAVYANNHFGIKCHENWTGMTYTADDDELNECFRKYNSVLESYADHSEFLRSRDRYAFLFELQITDYRGWAKGLANAGYATDPNYASKLIEIIEMYKLYRFDRMVIMPEKPTTVDPHQPPITKPNSAVVLTNNDVKYVLARPGDTYFKLAKELDMGLWQLYKYNETGKNGVLKTGDIVYLQPKRRKASVEYHTVMKGETMYLISQKYGIRLKHLYKKNRMNPGEEPKPGDILYLRKKKRA